METKSRTDRQLIEVEIHTLRQQRNVNVKYVTRFTVQVSHVYHDGIMCRIVLLK